MSSIQEKIDFLQNKLSLVRAEVSRLEQRTNELMNAGVKLVGQIEMLQSEQNGKTVEDMYGPVESKELSDNSIEEKDVSDGSTDKS